MAAPSGTTYPGGGNPIGTSMVFAHRAVRAICDAAASPAGVHNEVGDPTTA